MRKNLLVYLLTCLVLAGSIYTTVNATNSAQKEGQTVTFDKKTYTEYSDPEKTVVAYTEVVLSTSTYDIKTGLTTVETETTRTDKDGNVIAGYPKKEKKTSEDSLVPDSVAMSLGFKDDDKVMPANFRGGDPDNERIHILEDVPYEKHEHTVIYSGGKGESADAVAAGAEFNSDPNIIWTVTSDDDGSEYVDEDCDLSKGSDYGNTNLAHNGGAIKKPGTYTIGNGGATLVNEKVVTANQSTGCEVHDCTPPDVWVAFRENAGINAATYEQDKDKYEKKLGEDIVTNLGNPYKKDELSKEDVSYIMIDEGGSGERNKNPLLAGTDGKTARVTIAGPMFNPDGNSEGYAATQIEAGVNDSDNMLLQFHVTSDKDGLFVRRNVPFNYVIKAVDNGDRRKALLPEGNIVSRIETEDGQVITVDEESKDYIFRKPNYPQEDYPTEPKYFFVAKVVDNGMNYKETYDKKGNITSIRIPVYVLNSSASFESTLAK